jgi:hypothetical protein
VIPGVEVAMGGETWLIPPLTLGQLRRLMPKVRQLTDVDASMGEPQIAVLVEIVATALQRNYPNVTFEQVENLLDLGNAGAVLNAVLTGSGLKTRGSPLGETVAVAMPVAAPETAGNTSTASSPPPAATAIP